MTNKETIQEFERKARIQLDSLKASSDARIKAFVDRGMAHLNARIAADRKELKQ